MPEDIRKNQPVDASVGMIADSDERSLGQCFKPGALHGVTYPEIFQNVRSKVRSLKGAVPVVCLLDAVKPETSENPVHKKMPGPAAEKRRSPFEFFQFDKCHNISYFFFFLKITHSSITKFTHPDTHRASRLQKTTSHRVILSIISRNPIFSRNTPVQERLYAP